MCSQQVFLMVVALILVPLPPSCHFHWILQESHSLKSVALNFVKPSYKF